MTKHVRISKPTMEEIGATDCNLVPAIVSLMALICAPTLVPLVTHISDELHKQHVDRCTHHA